MYNKTKYCAYALPTLPTFKKKLSTCSFNAVSSLFMCDVGSVPMFSFPVALLLVQLVDALLGQCSPRLLVLEPVIPWVPLLT